jgi:hypothetical protein
VREFESFWKWFMEYMAEMRSMDEGFYVDYPGFAFYQQPFPAPSGAAQRQQREAQAAQAGQQRLQELQQKIQEQEMRLHMLEQQQPEQQLQQRELQH